MPYLIKGPVPTQAVGKCPWCENENKVLHLMAVTVDGHLGGEYVCAKCILVLDEMREQAAKEKGKPILFPNPKVEVAEDETGSTRG